MSKKKHYEKIKLYAVGGYMGNEQINFRNGDKLRTVPDPKIFTIPETYSFFSGNIDDENLVSLRFACGMDSARELLLDYEAGNCIVEDYLNNCKLSYHSEELQNGVVIEVYSEE